MSIRITAYNRGPDPADLHILPQLFFRNTWSWYKDLPEAIPSLRQDTDGVIEATHATLGKTRLYCTPSPAPAAPAKGGVVLVDGPSVVPELLFTENDTNFQVRLRFFSTAYRLLTIRAETIQWEEPYTICQRRLSRSHHSLSPTKGTRARVQSWRGVTDKAGYR